MAESRTPNQPWCAQCRPEILQDQRKSSQDVALQYQAQPASPKIISMGYASCACVNCRRSALMHSCSGKTMQFCSGVDKVPSPPTSPHEPSVDSPGSLFVD